MRGIDRRALLAAAATALFGDAARAAAIRFRDVRIDTRPFAAKGVSRYAAKVGERLKRAVAEAFAGRLVPGDRAAPVLVIEVSTVRLAAWAGGGSPGFGNDSLDTDEMDGALVVLSAKGSLVERRRHYASSEPSNGGPWYLPDNEDRRLDALCRLYAAWAVREFE